MTVNTKRNSLSIEEKLLISISSVLNKRKRCSFGEIVKQSFEMFPETFAVSQFPQWPDSLKLDRQLRKLREKGLITGSPLIYYSLTEFGKNVASHLKKEGRMRLGKTLIARKPTRNPDLLLLEEISRDPEFLKYLKNKNSYKLENMRIREIVKFTLETPNNVVINFLNRLCREAKRKNKTDIADFLNLYTEFLKERR